MDKLKPLEITAERENKIMIINWNDGQICKYPFALLRKVCPCAECRGEESPKPEEDQSLDLPLLELPIVDVRTTMVRQLNLVGNYALNITWEDGHQFGLYNWDYLRKLCAQL